MLFSRAWTLFVEEMVALLLEEGLISHDDGCWRSQRR